MEALKFLPGTICILIAGYLASIETGGYGWFIGLGFVLTVVALENTKD